MRGDILRKVETCKARYAHGVITVWVGYLETSTGTIWSSRLTWIPMAHADPGILQGWNSFRSDNFAFVHHTNGLQARVCGLCVG